MDRHRLERIAQRQLGLFTRVQARACGYSPKQIRARIRAGNWRPLLGRVLAMQGVRPTLRVQDRAAQLAVPGSVLAGPSAARIWAIPAPDTRQYLLVSRDSHPSVAGTVLLRTPIDRRDILVVDGALVTSRERTVFDCLRLLPLAAATDLLDRALQRRWLTIAEIERRVRAHVGRRGVRQLRQLLHTARGGTRSAGERLLARMMIAAGVAGWLANVAIHDALGLIGVGDFVFERARLVIELDGFAFHVTPDRFQRDRERQNRLIAAGWTVLRFTWRDLNERPHYVIRTIRAMLARLEAA